MPLYPGIFAAAAAAAEPTAAAVEATTVDNTGGSFTTSITVAHNNPVGGNKLLVFVATGKASTGAATGLGATYNDVSMDHKGGTGINGNSSRTECHLFELDDPATGENNIVFTLDDSSRIAVFAYSLSNAGTLGTVATDTDIATPDEPFPVELAIASSEGDPVLWGLTWRNSGSSLTFGDGQTGVDDQGVGGQSSRAGASWKDGSATSTTMDATLSAESGIGDFANRVAMVGVAVAGA